VILPKAEVRQLPVLVVLLPLILVLQQIVPFGQKGYSDYTKHKDKTRKARYIKRHSGMGEHWNKPDTPGALSYHILWNKPSFKASVADFKKRFDL
jgi:hypothetical protein